MGHPPRNGTNRVGRHQRAVLRALLGYNMVMTTRELFPFVWPRLDPDQPWPEWKWLKVRRAAEKFAFRLGAARSAAEMEAQARGAGRADPVAIEGRWKLEQKIARATCK